jgi:ABC-2 type transport system permease protein
MSGARLALLQLRYDQKSFWRNPMYVFFTVIQPIIFLFIFVTVFGNDFTQVNGHIVKRSSYYVPGILALAVVSATFFNLTISLTRMRERGILKRVRSTPLPPWMFLGGRVGSCIVVTALLVVLLVGIGRVGYGVAVPTDTLPGVVIALLVGAASFCCLAFAFTSRVPTEDAAAPMTNAIVLPLLFISGVFIPNEELPASMQHVADVFPIKHLFEALLTGFDPATASPGVDIGHLAVITAWGVAGLLVALLRFGWSPRAE